MQTKRRKVERITINERGEEVTEMVWEEYDVKKSDQEKNYGTTTSTTTATDAPYKQNKSTLNSMNEKSDAHVSESVPKQVDPQPVAQKNKAAKGGAKFGAKTKQQTGIMSFFTKK